MARARGVHGLAVPPLTRSETRHLDKEFSLLKAAAVMCGLLLLLGGASYLLFPHGLGSAARDERDLRHAVQASRDSAAADSARGRAPNALVDSAAAAGSCRVVERPVELARHLSEASGVAASARTPGIYWTHNDNGKPRVFAFDSTGAERGRVEVTGAEQVNWEDMAVAPCAGGSCLYVADIGDNAANRPQIAVYRVPEPAPGDSASQPASAFPATYPDGPQDAEAMFVLRGRIYIVTKGETGPIAIYRYPANAAPGAVSQLEKVAELRDQETRRRERITGAGASPDGRWVAMRTLHLLTVYPAAGIESGAPRAAFTYDLSPLGEAQGEGVAIADDGGVLLSSESGKKKKPGTFARLACNLAP